MQKKIIQTNEAPQAIGPYSQAVVANGFLFCSGQIALSAQPETPIPESVEDQTEQVMKNIEKVLRAAGSSFERVVKTTLFLTNMEDFAKVNAIYGKHFPLNPPARSTVAVTGLPRGVKVEIECLALV
jgi:2-iminobutanoate/2-iminopropanoate deaminase